jgi:hypothetical protein
MLPKSVLDDTNSIHWSRSALIDEREFAYLPQSKYCRISWNDALIIGSRQATEDARTVCEHDDKLRVQLRLQPSTSSLTARDIDWK